MLVPRTPLLVIVAVLLIPAGALLAVPGLEPVGWVFAVWVSLAAIIDAAVSRRRLSGLVITSPELVRMWKGRVAQIDLTLQWRSGSPTSLRLALPLPGVFAVPTEHLDIPSPKSPTVRVSQTCTPGQRGRYSVSLCAAETRSLAGLWSVRRNFPLQTEIRVYPDVSSSRDAAFLSRGLTGAKPQRQIGRGREFEKLRDYAPGDGFDEVDWKATARRGRPITRVFQIEKTQEVYAVIDSSRLMARVVPGYEPDTILERYISAALLLAIQAQRQGDRFGLMTFSDRVHGFVRAQSGKAHYGACRETLYALQPRHASPDFDEACAQIRLKLRRRALIIFLTELDDPVLAESFVQNVRLLRRSHVVLVGMLRPAGAAPVFEGAAPQTSDAVYEHLAGHLEWRKLRELERVLKRENVTLRLLEPSNLALELAQSYVNLKRRQVL